MEKLSLHQVASILGVESVKAVYALIYRDLLHAKRDEVFNRLYIEKQELERYQQVRRGVGRPVKIIEE